MKRLHQGILTLLVLLAIFGGQRAAAADFELSLTGSADPVIVGNALTYTVFVTNRSGILLSNVLVSDFYPSTVTLISASNSFGLIGTNVGVVIFQIDSMPNNAFAVVSLTVSPTVAGSITNIVTVGASNTVPVSVSLPTSVFNAFADLSLTFKGPTVQVLSNDWMTYLLAVTNTGPSSVSGVVLSNRLPANVGIISVIPANQAFTSNSLIFNIGTLASGGFAQYQVRVQPTNAGLQTFSATVFSSGLLDTNLANNIVSTNINVVTNIPSGLTAALVSGQTFNPQTGLMEQTLRLTNTGTNAIPSARVIVMGLTNWLFNAAGTNNGLPFVRVDAPIGTGENLDLLLKYFVPSKTAITNPALVADAVAFFQPPVPSGATVPISRLVLLPSGKFLIEFPSVLGRNYTVLYSHDGSFSNTYVVQPKIIAPADRVQWIDDGPPATVSVPRATSARFFRVLAD